MERVLAWGFQVGEPCQETTAVACHHHGAWKPRPVGPSLHAAKGQPRIVEERSEEIEDDPLEVVEFTPGGEERRLSLLEPAGADQIAERQVDLPVVEIRLQCVRVLPRKVSLLFGPCDES